MNFLYKTHETRRDLHLRSSHARRLLRRLFDADQVADGLSDFETEAESEDSMYNESER